MSAQILPFPVITLNDPNCECDLCQFNRAIERGEADITLLAEILFHNPMQPEGT